MSPSDPNPDADALHERLYLFLSYASDDRPSVQRLYDDLLSDETLQERYGAVWMDRAEIAGGDAWRREIIEGLLDTRIFLAVLTKHSVDPTREVIRFEHREAIRLFRRVIPLIFEDCDIPDYFDEKHYVDFRPGWEHGLKELRNAIHKHLPRTGPEGGKRFSAAEPSPGRPFVGREEDLRAVFALVDREAKHIRTGRQTVAIQGMGGSGKTMLAHELVRRIAVHYPGGVAVEPRGDKPMPALDVLQQWARRSLGHLPNPKWTVIDVRDHLHKKYGELLVLVDDVSDEDLAETRQILDACPPDASRLITTRSEAVASESGTLGCLMHSLGDFSPDDALAFLGDRFAKKTGEPPSRAILDELVRCLGGHPLSLELVSGNCKHAKDLRVMTEELQQRLKEGEIDDIALDDADLSRQTSLSICLRLSLEGLERRKPEWVERFFALGIFPNGAKQYREMIGAVWGVESQREVRRCLNFLSGRALVNLEDQADAVAYKNHPLVRAYAHGHLKKDKTLHNEVVERYAQYVIELARKGFEGSPETWVALEDEKSGYRPHIHYVGTTLLYLIEREIRLAPLVTPVPTVDPSEVLGGAAEHFLEKTLGRDVRLGSDFAAAVTRYFVLRPEVGEIGRQCLEMGLACARILGDAEGEIRFLDALGQWHEKREPDTALAYFEQAARQAQSRNDRAMEATILTHLGELLRTQSRPEEALKLLSRALVIHREQQNEELEAATLKSVGETHWRLGNHETALESHLEALSIFMEAGILQGEGDMYNKIGSVHFNQGEYEKAIAHFEQALAIHKKVRDRSMQAEDLNDMAIAYRYLEKVWKALPPLIEALTIHQATGALRLQAITMCNMANIYVFLELPRAALGLANDALRIANDVQALVPKSWALCWKGQALQRLGKRAEAVEYLTQAVEVAREASNPRGVAGHLGYLGCVYQELGETDRAIDSWAQAVALMNEKSLPEAYGGRQLDEFHELIRQVSPPAH